MLIHLYYESKPNEKCPGEGTSTVWTSSAVTSVSLDRQPIRNGLGSNVFLLEMSIEMEKKRRVFNEMVMEKPRI